MTVLQDNQRNGTVTVTELDPLLGTVVHNYIVRKRLAEGGMGAVYLAEHQDPRSASKKVIKILLPAYSKHEIIRQRFEHEALAVMRLKHPYIVEIDNFGTLPDGQLYLMMEFLEGETLEAHLQRRGRCSLHHTLHIVAQIMSALQSLHDAGLVHRDLKPANVFIVCSEQNPYEVRLIDLGIARNLAEPERKKKTVTGIAMGTPGYMAVEQYEDAANATPAADVYAAAVIVWRMLFGQPPWGEIYDERVLYFRQRSEDFEPPPGHEVPVEVIELLRKALSKEPTERPTVADFVNRLASFTPGIAPFVPSGAMILSDVAKKFIKHASVNDETVRNMSHGVVAAPMSWPYRGTHVPRPASEPVRSHDVLQAPPSSPTANERPPAARPTTLGASSGVMERPHARARPWRALLGVVTAAVAGIAAFAIVQVRTSGGEESPRNRGAATQPVSDAAANDNAPMEPPASVSASDLEPSNGSGAAMLASPPPSPPATASPIPSAKHAIDSDGQLPGSAEDRAIPKRSDKTSAESAKQPGIKKRAEAPTKKLAPSSASQAPSSHASETPSHEDVPFDPDAVME